MDRRKFLGQVLLGSAAITAASGRLQAQAPAGGLVLHGVGMMGYVTRSDGSMLVAMPGPHSMGHHPHTPFLMASAGSPVAVALGLTAMPGVVAGAFDARLANAAADAFVFRCLEGSELEVTTGAVRVDNQANQLAQMPSIAPGRRLRQDLRRWASANVLLHGGRLDNAAAHPDAGKVWSFGAYQQRLTDATCYTAASATLRLSSGRDVRTFQADAGSGAEVWVVSAAGPRTEPADPRRLTHGAALFQFFAEGEPIVATCDDATGRITVPTEMPCASGVASAGVRAAATAPPFADLCYGGEWP